MSSEMSVDLSSVVPTCPVTSALNPFETLSDDPILHIFSFLSGADLLKLSAMDKNFNRIITKSTKTMSKIRLVLDFNKEVDLDFVIELDAKVKLSSTLQLLSDFVDDLAVVDGISKEFLSSIMAMFLLKLKKLKLALYWSRSGAVNLFKEISQQSNVNPRLESLELDRDGVEFILHQLTGCNQLKTFCCRYLFVSIGEESIVKDFLATQDHLEKLVVPTIGLPWNRLKCFQLKDLEAYCSSGTDDQNAAAEFLKKLPKLTKLNIEVGNRHSRPLMEAICRIPKLETLTIQCNGFGVGNEAENEEALERLENRTVKKLHIVSYWHGTATANLLKIFRGVKKISLSVDLNWDKVLDLSDVPPGTLKKISLENDDNPGMFVVKFAPSEIPTNVEQFESTVMKFAEEFSSVIVGIEIGHVSWRNSGDFRLSNSFCEGLVNQLPRLQKIKVYNIAHRKRFFSFLIKNRHRLVELDLLDINIHEPLGAGERKPSKI